MRDGSPPCLKAQFKMHGWMICYFFWGGGFAPSLSLRAARECQSKEKLQEQGFRSAYREFQQWLVNTKINTAKCFDAPQNLSEASTSLQKIQVTGNRVLLQGTDVLQLLNFKLTLESKQWKLTLEQMSKASMSEC